MDEIDRFNRSALDTIPERPWPRASSARLHDHVSWKVEAGEELKLAMVAEGPWRFPAP